jgi:hypothetical protein
VTRSSTILLAATLSLAACSGAGTDAADSTSAVPGAAAHTSDTSMNQIGEQYARLVLALGTHDADYVDAYYGPPEWRSEAEAAKLPLDSIRERAAALVNRLGDTPPPGLDSLERLRHGYLVKQLGALVARAEMLQGRELSFDEESRLLYDAVAPTHPEAHYRAVLDRLSGVLPGSGPVAARYEAWRNGFVIPPATLDTVFQTAIAACRERTMRHVRLPEGEQFTVEYVTDKPWSGYNWYQGGFRSLIQVNTDLPIYIDRALDLACHEGYPGHHVYNALLEQNLVRGRGWREFSVYALFSPQSLIAEGSANHGVAMAFPGDERVTWEREVLFPLAGLDGARAAEYYRVQELVRELSYAGNEAARRYLNGEIDGARAAEWLVTYALMTPQAAEQRVRFFDTYRSYVINYNLGQDLVREYVERATGANATEAQRWAVFAALLSSPRLPSDLRAATGAR